MKQEKEPICLCCGRGKLETTPHDPREPGPVLSVKCALCGWEPDLQITMDLRIPPIWLGGEAAYVAGYTAGLTKAIDAICDLYQRGTAMLVRRITG